MNGSFDVAGVFFAVLVLVGAIPMALNVFRRREPSDAVTRFAGRSLLVAAIVNGVANMIRRMGLMPDDSTYQALDIASLAVCGVMLWLVLRRNRQYKKI
jgi:hypothetical protein